MRDLVVKDNALINASYNLDLVEQRLILLAIVEARESGKGINANDPLEVHADNYINQFGVHRNTAYQALKDACKDLFARQFSYQEKKANGNVRNVMSRWVSQIAYNDNEATVDLIFAPAVVPFITRLEEQFTKYELQQISSLSSAYAIRLYELLIQWRSAGKTPTIELQDFRKKLGVLDNEYLRMAHLKERVLELSIKQINEHTDITVKYEQHKRGRSISGFSFTFKQKKKDSPSIERDPNTLDLSSKMTDAQRHMFANKLSELPEMGRYSQGTESYPQFAVRIAEMLQDPEKIKELAPYLKKVGYMPLNKKDLVNG
ncbi:replication initiation protein RepM [Acinetobacter indicus]|uniref:replication initiation protein RepM n=1 Tax=Acinetobacter indicus TaxID=756892 RepID=UPI0034D486E1